MDIVLQQLAVVSYKLCKYSNREFLCGILERGNLHSCVCFCNVNFRSSVTYTLIACKF